MENNDKTEMIKKSFCEKNRWIIFLIGVSLIMIGINIYDKNHSSKIEVVVDPSLSKNVISEEKKENLKIFVYNSQTNAIEENEVEIPKKKTLLEGDYISEIIEGDARQAINILKNTSVLNEKIKFLSAYTLYVEGQKTTIVKLNSEFLEIKNKKAFYEGFVKSIVDTVKLYDRSVQNVQIQIDGDAVVQ